MADFVIYDKSFSLAGVFGSWAENRGVFYNKVSRGIDNYFRAFRKSNTFAVVFDWELNRAGIAGLNKGLGRADKRQAKDSSRSMQEFINSNFWSKNSAKEIFCFFGHVRRAYGAKKILYWCQRGLQRLVAISSLDLAVPLLANSEKSVCFRFAKNNPSGEPCLIL